MVVWKSREKGGMEVEMDEKERNETMVPEDGVTDGREQPAAGAGQAEGGRSQSEGVSGQPGIGWNQPGDASGRPGNGWNQPRDASGQPAEVWNRPGYVQNGPGGAAGQREYMQNGPGGVAGQREYVQNGPGTASAQPGYMPGGPGYAQRQQGYAWNQQGYVQNQNGYSVAPSPYQGAPQMPERYLAGSESAVKVSEWLVTLLLLSIPCVGFILMIVWGFGDTAEKESKVNFCRASLIWTGILCALVLVIYLVVALVMAAGL